MVNIKIDMKYCKIMSNRSDRQIMQPNRKTPAIPLLDKILFLGENEDGFLLVVTMLILVVLTIIGISATHMTQVELKIAGNDRVHKETFYEADGGTELGMRLAYDNAVCLQVNKTSGFATNENEAGVPIRKIGDIKIWDLDFSQPQTLASSVVSDANRHVTYYTDGVVADTSPHTNLLFNVSTVSVAGSGMQMVQGYEGLGGGSPSATNSKFKIYSQHFGDQASQSIIAIGWQMSTSILNAASSSDCNPVYR
ncbi:MAG: hypothetical protein HGA69_00020 [Desulfobulbaceae bacterium]|nr:hypothetical protein [Desulfobulbaceae bacterium]